VTTPTSYLENRVNGNALQYLKNVLHRTVEWDVLGNILRENLIPKIKQLEIEYHIFPNFPPHEDYVKGLQVYQALWFLDFKRYYTLVHQNHQDKDKPHLQADVAYVNMHYKNEEFG
jgi:hypothetical protein